MHPQKGELAQVLDNIEGWFAQNRVAIFWGYETNDATLPSFEWDTSKDPRWESFLNSAKQAGVSLIAVDYDVYEPPDMDAYEFTEEDASEALTLVEKLRPHESEIVIITLKWIRDSVVHRFIIEADWENELRELQEMLPEENEDDEDFGGSLDDETIERHAQTLAAAQSFQNAKNRSQRAYAFNKVLKELQIEDELDVDRILDRAQALYELEIRPKHELDLGEKIRELKASGLKTNEIAQKLGLTTQKVRQLS